MSLLEPSRKKSGKYLNAVPTSAGGFKTMLKVLPLFLRNQEETEPSKPLGPFQTDAAIYREAPASGLRITWFGHSGMLVEIDGFRVLIDPIWEKRAGPLDLAGPKRFFAPTLPLEALPELDAVLVSHDHYDHFGARTLRKLASLPSTRQTVWITSLGVGRRLEKLGIPAGHISALDWTQSREIASPTSEASLQVTSWPSRHFSGRGLLDRNSTLWASFVLEGPEHRIYFGSDSGPWGGFAEIGAHYDRFDLIMLEIGAYHPLWGDIHLGPENASRAYLSMGGPEKCGPLFPIHWGLFNLALHAWRQPIEQMLVLSEEQSFPLWLTEPGRPTEVTPARLEPSRWWKSY